LERVARKKGKDRQRPRVFLIFSQGNCPFPYGTAGIIGNQKWIFYEFFTLKFFFVLTSAG
jgi:hypothetical protein